jgi:hypothetical protein
MTPLKRLLILFPLEHSRRGNNNEYQACCIGPPKNNPMPPIFTERLKENVKVEGEIGLSINS